MGKNIKIEVLYGEFANLFGELQNVNYLAQCMPEAKIIKTALHDRPSFLDGDVDMVYMGAMSEGQQELVIEALTPYKRDIEAQIDAGTIFLCTGNAMECFESFIENEDGTKITGLGIFDTHAKRDMMHRYNSLILGQYEDIKLVGFKAQFSHSFGDNSGNYFFNVLKGDGLNPSTKRAVLKRKNFFGTYLVGPFLVYNPLFVKYLMNLMGATDAKLAHEEVIMAAYEQRLKEFEDDKIRLT